MRIYKEEKLRRLYSKLTLEDGLPHMNLIINYLSFK